MSQPWQPARPHDVPEDYVYTVEMVDGFRRGKWVDPANKVVQAVAVSTTDIDVEQQVVTAIPVDAPVVARSRSQRARERALQRASSVASSSVAPIALVRQHSHKAWVSDDLKEKCSQILQIIACLLLLSLQFVPHVVPLLIALLAGGGVCAQPLEQWLTIVGYGGLAAHVIILLFVLCCMDGSDGSGAIAFVIIVLVFLGWQVSVFLFIQKSFDCLPFDVAQLNRLDINRTLFAEPLLPDATLASSRAHALEACEPDLDGVLDGANQTLPCLFVLNACESALWHGARGVAIFWIIIDGIISAFAGGGCSLMLAAT